VPKRSAFPGIVTVAVKKAADRSRAAMSSSEKAQALIREGAERAVRMAHTLKPFALKPPITLELTYYRPDMADDAALRPGNERINARTLRRVVQSAAEVLRM
jgi:D-amino peptidase